MKIIAGKVEQYQDGEESLQRVPWEIVEMKGKKKTVLFEGVQSFPLDATTKQIRAFLEQTLAVHKEDSERFAEASVRQRGLDNAAEVAGEITGIEITD